jgi:hypothetical protein
MSQHVEGPRKTFKAGTALEPFRRVKITDATTSPKTVGYAGVTDQAIGVTEQYHASGADCTIYLANAQGTRKMTAAGAITGGNEVYAAADGKVAGSGTVVEGKALETVTTNGDLLEVLPTGNIQSVTRPVEAHTANDTLTAAETGSTHTNAGATGTVTLTLPAAVAGLEFTFHVQAAQQLRIDPNGTETIALPSSGAQGAAGKYLWADAVGEWVKLVCVEAGTWDVEGYNGTWTAEA